MLLHLMGAVNFWSVLGVLIVWIGHVCWHGADK